MAGYSRNISPNMEVNLKEKPEMVDITQSVFDNASNDVMTPKKTVDGAMEVCEFSRVRREAPGASQNGHKRDSAQRLEVKEKFDDATKPEMVDITQSVLDTSDVMPPKKTPVGTMEAGECSRVSEQASSTSQNGHKGDSVVNLPYDATLNSESTSGDVESVYGTTDLADPSEEPLYGHFMNVTEKPRKSKRLMRNSYSCNSCKFKTSSKSKLVIHMKLHKGEGCNIYKEGKPEVKQRKKNHCDASSFFYSCEFCDFRTKKLLEFRIHVRSHTGEKPYTCGICNFSCVAAGALKIHMRSHVGQKPFSCKYCDCKFGVESNLKVHMMIHTGEKPFACELCNYRSSECNKLEKHLRIHTGEKPFACDECEYKCYNMHSLMRHSRSHTGEKPFACNICDYKCTEARNLKRHVMTHTGEKPYACNVCQYKCTTANTLKRHMRTHTKERPYACTTCEYKSSNAGDLKKHLVIHTGEKSYVCDICDNRFARATHLKRHVREKHKTSVTCVPDVAAMTAGTDS